LPESIEPIEPGEPPEKIGEVFYNIKYKTVGLKELQLDIFTPTVKTENKIPVLIYIHGGSWNSGNRSIASGMFADIFDEIRALGVAVIPVTYRLTTVDTIFPAHINDVCDAIRFIIKNAEKYNFDIEKIGLIGLSAGGHLSLLAALCDTEFGDDPDLAEIDFKIKCVIDFCGPCDFTQIGDYDDEVSQIYALALLSSFLGRSFTGNEEYYAYASPITHINNNSNLAIIFIQGQNDELVPFKQVERMYELCLASGMDVKYIPVENATHVFMPFETSKPISPSMEEIKNLCSDFILNKLIN